MCCHTLQEKINYKKKEKINLSILPYSIIPTVFGKFSYYALENLEI